MNTKISIRSALIEELDKMGTSRAKFLFFEYEKEIEGKRKKYLDEISVPRPSFKIAPELIISIVSQQTGISVERMGEKTRKREVVFARQLSYALIRECCNPIISYEASGNLFSQDHATAMHGETTVHNLCDTDKKVLSLYTDVKARVLNHSMSLLEAGHPNYKPVIIGDVEISPYKKNVYEIIEKTSKITCEELKITLDDLRSKSREADLLWNRYMFYKLLRDCGDGNIPYADMAYFLKNNNHTTPLMAIRACDELIENNKDFCFRYNRLKNKVLKQVDFENIL